MIINDNTNRSTLLINDQSYEWNLTYVHVMYNPKGLNVKVKYNLQKWINWVCKP